MGIQQQSTVVERVPTVVELGSTVVGHVSIVELVWRTATVLDPTVVGNSASLTLWRAVAE